MHEYAYFNTYRYMYMYMCMCTCHVWMTVSWDLGFGTNHHTNSTEIARYAAMEMESSDG